MQSCCDFLYLWPVWKLWSDQLLRWVVHPYCYSGLYVIGQAGASPPSRATGTQFFLYIHVIIYVRQCNADTVISISLSRVTSCACAQSLSTCFARESDEGCNYALSTKVSTEEREVRYQRHCVSGHCAR